MMDGWWIIPAVFTLVSWSCWAITKFGEPKKSSWLRLGAEYGLLLSITVIYWVVYWTIGGIGQ